MCSASTLCGFCPQNQIFRYPSQQMQDAHFFSPILIFPPVLVFFAKNFDTEPYDKKDNKSGTASKECHSYNDTNLGPNVEPL